MFTLRERHILSTLHLFSGTIRLYLKSQDPFKMSFKLKLCSFVSVPSLFKKEINAFDSLGIERLVVTLIGTWSKLTRRPRGGGHIQISIQLKSRWCQGPTEFTWPWVLLNRNLLVDRRLSAAVSVCLRSLISVDVSYENTLMILIERNFALVLWILWHRIVFEFIVQLLIINNLKSLKI